jgi:hypothetical protein
MYNCGIVFRTLGYNTLLQFLRRNDIVNSNYPLSLSHVAVDEHHFELWKNFNKLETWMACFK